MDRKRKFSPQELQTMDLAYQHALRKLVTRYPETSDQTKEALRRKILLLASYNIDDPETLGALALDQITMSRRVAQKMHVRRVG